MTQEETNELRALFRDVVEVAKRDRGSVLERHAQTIMVGLVTIGIVWMSSSISGTSADVRVLQAQNQAMSAQITDMKETLNRLYDGLVTRTEFEQHNKEIDRRLRFLETHVQKDEQGWKSR